MEGVRARISAAVLAIGATFSMLEGIRALARSEAPLRNSLNATVAARVAAAPSAPLPHLCGGGEVGTRAGKAACR